MDLVGDVTLPDLRTLEPERRKAITTELKEERAVHAAVSEEPSCLYSLFQSMTGATL
jgi:hypothetical protein